MGKRRSEMCKYKVRPTTKLAKLFLHVGKKFCYVKHQLSKFIFYCCTLHYIPINSILFIERISCRKQTPCALQWYKQYNISKEKTGKPPLPLQILISAEEPNSQENP